MRTASGVSPWKSAVGGPTLPEAPRVAPAARGEGVGILTAPGYPGGTTAGPARFGRRAAGP
ncbi:hypothetical protein GCM10025773_09610 [Microbacterium jejuense]